MSQAGEQTVLPPEGQGVVLIDHEGFTQDQREQQVKDAIIAYAEGLQRLADEQVSKKNLIEERWLEDLRQFHGRYDSNVESELRKQKKSRLFVNLTRTKTHGWEARLGDLLFPTDDRNWGISATPVPELSRKAAKVQQAAQAGAARATAYSAQGNQPLAEQEAQKVMGLGAEHARLEAIIEEANDRADLMEEEIADQFVECRYDVRMRDAIRDMMRLGTAITKGPVTAQQMRKKWEQVQVAGTAAEGTAKDYQLHQSPDPRPEYVRVDPWSFFPDMSAATIESAEFTFERHLWNKKDLRAAAKRLDFDIKETALLLREKAQGVMPSYWANLRDITMNSSQSGTDERYQVWEYHGAIDDTDLETIVQATGNTEMLAFVKDNPLAEMRVIIWFCQGHILKVGPHPLDSGESLYSVCPFEIDDTSMFGFGVPYLMRDSQSAMNAAWRMTMDNAALSVGPQVVIDQQTVKPADKEWSLKPRKIWLMNTTSVTKFPEGYKPFQTFKIDSGQAELEAIVNMARQFADDETNMPQIAYGEQGAHVTKTAQGLSMMMNSVNVVFRRVVKQWDDWQTVPNLRRAYDWNMQFSKRDEIKGDYNVEARGSSVLLVREVQSQTLLQMLTQFSNNPVLGPLMKVAPAFRKFVQTQMIHVADVVKTDQEIESDQAKAEAAAKQGGNIDPTEKMKLDNAKAIADGKNQTDLKVAEIRRETALIELAQTHNITLDKLDNMLQIARENNAHKERIAAVEIATAEKDKADPKLGNL